MVVESWLVRAARAHPDRPAVGACTYAELLGRARAVAAMLEPGLRVGIDLPPGVAFAAALHGTLLAGASAVPLDPRMGPAERPAVDYVVTAVPEPAASAGAAGPADAMHDLGAVAVIVQTSGTTAAPREVALTYGNWLWSAIGSAVALGVAPGERWLAAMPLTHVGGLSILLRSAIYATTAIVHERFETERVLQALRDPAGPTIVSLVPTTLRRLLDAGLAAPPALRTVLLGGAPIPSGLLADAAAAGVPVTPTYGLTEACSQVATAGVPLFCTDVRIAEDDEVIVSGPTVAGGGPLATGDLGRFGADGRLEITGRKADTIITGGENVAPAEVEAVLEAHPAVIEAAVVGRPDPEWGEALHAIVRLREDASDGDLAAHCRERLAPHKRPKTFVRTTAPLPRTGSGKLLRRSLGTP